MEEQTIIEDSPAKHGGWSRGDKLILAAVVLFVLNLGLLALTEVQIQTREKNLDTLQTTAEESRDAAKKASDDLAAAIEAQSSSDIAQVFQRLVTNVEAIAQEVCGGPCPTPPKSETGG